MGTRWKWKPAWIKLFLNQQVPHVPPGNCHSFGWISPYRNTSGCFQVLNEEVPLLGDSEDLLPETVSHPYSTLSRGVRAQPQPSFLRRCKQWGHRGMEQRELSGKRRGWGSVRGRLSRAAQVPGTSRKKWGRKRRKRSSRPNLNRKKENLLSSPLSHISLSPLPPASRASSAWREHTRKTRGFKFLRVAPLTGKGMEDSIQGLVQNQCPTTHEGQEMGSAERHRAGPA